MKLKTIGMAILVAGVTLAITARAEERIVFVNLDRIFNSFYKTKMADGQLKQQASEFNTERKKLTDDLEKLQQDYNAVHDEALNTALSDDVRDQKKTEAEDKIIEIRENQAKITRLDDSIRRQLGDQMRRMQKRIVDEIRLAIQNYARTEGVTAVLDSSALTPNGVEMAIYTDVKNDISDEIIEIINKGKPADMDLEKATGPEATGTEPALEKAAQPAKE